MGKRRTKCMLIERRGRSGLGRFIEGSGIIGEVYDCCYTVQNAYCPDKSDQNAFTIDSLPTYLKILQKMNPTSHKRWTELVPH